MDVANFQTSVKSRTKTYNVNLQKIQGIGHQILLYLGMEHYNLDIELVNAKSIRQLNQLYRKKNKSTDVLAFPQYNWPKPVVPNKRKSKSHVSDCHPLKHLGDIVISLPNAQKNADVVGHDLDHEVVFLLIHGILHLCGYDHVKKNQKKLMNTQQELLLERLKHQPKIWKNCVQKTARH